MTPPEAEAALPDATRHVARAREMIARQLARIDILKATGSSVLDAEQTLDVFLGTLAILEDHERRLRKVAGLRR